MANWPENIEDIRDGHLRGYLKGELTLEDLRRLHNGIEPYEITAEGDVRVIPQAEYNDRNGLPNTFDTYTGPVPEYTTESRASAPVYPWLISVCINVHNEGPRLRATIEDYRANFSEGAQVEYVVFDDGSDDGCCNDLGEDVIVVRSDERVGCAKAKRRAAETAKGRMLMFCDAHHAVLKGYLTQLAVESERLDGVVCPALGRISYDDDWKPYRSSDLLAVPREGGFWRGGIYEWTHRTPCGVRKVDTAGCFCAMKREVYDRLGGYMHFAGTYGMQEYGMSIRCLAAGVAIWVKACVVVGHDWRSQFPYSAPPYRHQVMNEWHMYRAVLSDEVFHEYALPFLSHKPGADKGVQALATVECRSDSENFQANHRKLSDEQLLDALHIPHEEIPLTVAVPYGRDGNLGAAYNRIMENAQTDWVLLLDHDVMFCSANWYRQIQFAMRALRAKAGIVTCWTNRIGCPQQRQKDSPRSDDLREHFAFAATLWDTTGWRLSRIDQGGTLVSGMVMLINRTVWRAVGPFADGFLGVDNEYDKRLREAGFPPFRIDGLYAYHAKITTGKTIEKRPVPQQRAM